MKSSHSQYGSVAVTLHWLSALLIIALMISGSRAADTIDPATKAELLSLHAPVGITVLVLTLLRLFWWWRVDVKPAPNQNDPRWQTRIASGVHVLFYIVIVGMAASGIGMLVLSGAGAILFGGAEGTLPDFMLYPPRIPHGIGAKLMMVLFVLHAGAAVFHHFVKRDGILKRMWFTTRR
ncbi:MAG: cytochrome b/b6 domain-containing protein [Sneathiella sp.]